MRSPRSGGTDRGPLTVTHRRRTARRLEGRRWIYDGVHDPAFIAAWLDLMRSRRHHAVGRRLRPPRGVRPPPAPRHRHGAGAFRRAVEQFGDRRRRRIGRHPEVLPRALRGPEPGGGNRRGPDRRRHRGSSGDPRVGHRRMGDARARTARAAPGPAQGELAVAHEFLAGGLDAWRLAVDAASRGTGFTAEAHALGVATATVHRRLAEALGAPPNPSRATTSQPA